MTTELLQSRDGPVLASAALCVAELVCTMKTHTLDLLNTFVPVILKLLKTHCCQNVPDVIAISIVNALQKIVEFLGNFLSPYLNKLLFELTRLNTLYIDKEHPKVFMFLSLVKDEKCKIFKRFFIQEINFTRRIFYSIISKNLKNLAFFIFEYYYLLCYNLIYKLLIFRSNILDTSK